MTSANLRRWLARNHVYCVACHHEGRGWVKVANPRKERNPVNPRTSAAYWRETYAAIREHYASEHPRIRIE